MSAQPGPTSVASNPVRGLLVPAYELWEETIEGKKCFGGEGHDCGRRGDYGRRSGDCAETANIVFFVPLRKPTYGARSTSKRPDTLQPGENALSH